MNVEQIALEFQIDTRRRTLNQRAINRLVQTDTFAEAWKAAEKDDRSLFVAAVTDCDVEYVRNWIRRVSRNNLLDCSIRELRVTASRHHIKNYSRMQKDELVSALIEKGIETDVEGFSRDGGELT